MIIIKQAHPFVYSTVTIACSAPTIVTYTVGCEALVRYPLSIQNAAPSLPLLYEFAINPPVFGIYLYSGLTKSAKVFGSPSYG